MIAAIIIISLAFAWLGHETDWMRIRLLVGIPKPQRNTWLDKAIICSKCRDCKMGNKDRFLCYKIPARTISYFGSTLNFAEGCNYRRAMILKAIRIEQLRKGTYPVSHYTIGFAGGMRYGREADTGEITIKANGKSITVNGDYKKGMIKQFVKGH